MQIDGQELHILFYWLGGIAGLLLGVWARKRRGKVQSGHSLIRDFSDGVTLLFLLLLLPSALLDMANGRPLTLVFDGSDSVILVFIVVRAAYWVIKNLGD